MSAAALANNCSFAGRSHPFYDMRLAQVDVTESDASGLAIYCSERRTITMRKVVSE